VVLCVLTVSWVISLVAGDDSACKNDLQTFLKCVKDKYEAKTQAEKDAVKKDREDKYDKCFADAGCDGPDWSKDVSDVIKSRMKLNMSEPVKKCLKDKLIVKLGAKLNECMTKKGITNVNIVEVIKAVQASGISIEGHGKDDLSAVVSTKYNLVKAVDKCSQKKGGTDAVKPLEQCAHKVTAEAKPKICAFIKPCEDAVTADCKKRGQEIRKALCQCKKEKEADVAGKLRTLATGKDKVGLNDLIGTVAENQDIKTIIGDVVQCYKDNNEEIPPQLKVVMKFVASGGSSNAKMAAALSVNGSTCIIMADMLQIDADDPSECEPCA